MESFPKVSVKICKTNETKLGITLCLMFDFVKAKVMFVLYTFVLTLRSGSAKVKKFSPQKHKTSKEMAYRLPGID